MSLLGGVRSRGTSPRPARMSRRRPVLNRDAASVCLTKIQDLDYRCAHGASLTGFYRRRASPPRGSEQNPPRSSIRVPRSVDSGHPLPSLISDPICRPRTREMFAGRGTARTVAESNSGERSGAGDLKPGPRRSHTLPRECGGGCGEDLAAVVAHRLGSEGAVTVALHHHCPAGGWVGVEVREPPGG